MVKRKIKLCHDFRSKGDLDTGKKLLTCEICGNLWIFIYAAGHFAMKYT